MVTKIKCRLSSLLGERKLKISDVTRDTGISRTTLTALYYEKGDGISYRVLKELCVYLNCSVGDIFQVQKGDDPHE